jgi:para-nitrobenzyl esterase
VIAGGFQFCWSHHTRDQFAVYHPDHDAVRPGENRFRLVAGSGTTVRAFKGIPYAAPPVGDLRWKAPQPAKP